MPDQRWRHCGISYATKNLIEAYDPIIGVLWGVFWREAVTYP